MVLAPANPELHLEMCQQVLPFGKPTFVDKTFAPSFMVAQQIFEIAAAYNTAIQSASALRTSTVQDRLGKTAEPLRSMLITASGPTFQEYGIHPVELAVSCLGSSVESILFAGTDQYPQLILVFSNARTAVIDFNTQAELPFTATLLTTRGAEHVIVAVGRGGSVDVDGQRMFSCANSREAAKVPIWAACTLFVMLLLITLPILSVLVDHPEMYHASPGEREKAYSMLLAENLTSGVLGLAMAALLASVMSTVSGLMTYGAQTAVNDVLRPVLPKTSLLDPQSKACVWIGRLVMLAIMIAGVFVMLGAGSLFRIATIFSGMFGASGAFFWAQWWWWRINVASWLAAMIAGPFIYLGLGLVLPLWDWWDAQMQISPANADAMAMLQAVISIGLTTVCWLLTALLTAPESETTLVEFYRRARPLGLWKPICEAFRRE